MSDERHDLSDRLRDATRGEARDAAANDAPPDGAEEGLVEIHVHDDARDVAVAGAAMIAERLRAAIAAWGGATIALSGGDTPGPIYERLADAHRDDVDWSRVTVVYGDDRCVPPDHALSNHRMAERTLLSRVPLDPARVHRVRGELDPAAAADDYDRVLRAALADRADGAPLLDVNVMGIGPDGHTASHFPHAPSLDQTARWAVAVPAPSHVEPHVPRVTLTLPVLERAALVLFVVTGGGKQAPLRRALAEEPSAATPASLVMADGLTCWLLDAAAAEALGDVWDDDEEGDEEGGEEGDEDDGEPAAGGGGADAPPRRG